MANKTSAKLSGFSVLVQITGVQLIEDGVYKDTSIATVFDSDKCQSDIKVCVTVNKGK